ncbi:MAG: sensor histidine kinase [Kiloniellales bacterium]
MFGKKLALPSLAKGLSARLLLLTIAFVMLAEVLIYAPSIGRFRLAWLEERLAAGHLAILALQATPDQMVSEALEKELLSHVGAHLVALSKPGAGKLMLMTATPYMVDASYDLREGTFFGLIGDAAMTLLGDGTRVLRVVGTSPKDSTVLIETVLEEAPLRAEMIGYSERILALSLLISLVTAALVYLSLHKILVRPMRQITASMSAFRENPEDATRILSPGPRDDEIGIAQRELATMQEGLRGALQQKARLAALGSAVAKINHDLRNILSTAQLVSDRLASSHDPEVSRLTPTLMKAVDRAVELCARTLDFAREGTPVLQISRFDLKQLVDDVGASLPGRLNGEASWHNGVAEAIEIEADREQLFRVLANLGQNAIQAGASEIAVAAHGADGGLEVAVTDNGPGLPERAQSQLFQPFASVNRSGGSGLGLAIARELLRAHGGDIALAETGPGGSRFRLTLPLARGAAQRLGSESQSSASNSAFR